MTKRILLLLAVLLLLTALIGVGYTERYVCMIGGTGELAPAPDAEPLDIPAAVLDRLLSRAARQIMPNGKAPITYEIVSSSPVADEGRAEQQFFLRVRDADGFVTVVGVTVRPRWPWMA